MTKIINKLKKEWNEKSWKYKGLSVLGGINITLEIFTPIILVAIWISIAGLDNLLTYIFYGLGLLATLFRAIKVGYLKNY